MLRVAGTGTLRTGTDLAPLAGGLMHTVVAVRHRKHVAGHAQSGRKQALNSEDKSE